MNKKNTIYASVALLILVAATGLAVWYAYLTKQSVDSSRPKAFDPLTVPGSGDSGTNPFNNDEVTEKTFNDQTKNGQSGEENPGDTTNGATEGTNTDSSGTLNTTPTQTKKEVKLFKMYEGPVAGFTTYENDKKEIVARLAERQRGNIVDVTFTNQKAERVTNSTILGIQKAYFTKNAQHVLLQHLEDDDSLLTLSTPVAELAEKKEGDTDTAVGTYLPVNIQALAVRDDTILFSVLQEDSTLSVATTNLVGEKTKRVWKSPLRGWNISWSGEGVANMLVRQRASLGIPGYIYRISLTKGTIEKIFGDEPGVTALESPKGLYILKTTSSNDGYSSEIISKTGARVASKSHLFPEKCVWSPNETTLLCGVPVDTQGNSYPDTWMQGARIYADTIVRIDPKTGAQTNVIETVKGAPNGLDMTDAQYTNDGKNLLFIDKTTATLWGVTLE